MGWDCSCSCSAPLRPVSVDRVVLELLHATARAGDHRPRHDLPRRLTHRKSPAVGHWVGLGTERTGVAVPIRQGVLELAPSIHEAERLRAAGLSHATWLDDRELVALEPHLAHAVGALHYPRDGAVNPLVLLKALKQAVGKHVHIRVVQRTVAAIAVSRPDEPVTLTLADSTATSTTMSAMRVVIAAGAWSGGLAGVPMHLPIAPVRGQPSHLSAPLADRLGIQAAALVGHQAGTHLDDQPPR